MQGALYSMERPTYKRKPSERTVNVSVCHRDGSTPTLSSVTPPPDTHAQGMQTLNSIGTISHGFNSSSRTMCFLIRSHDVSDMRGYMYSGCLPQGLRQAKP